MALSKLQEEILQAILKDGYGPTQQVKAVSEVTLKWIERAYYNAYVEGVEAGRKAARNNYDNIGPEALKDNFLQENNLIEKQ